MIKTDRLYKNEMLILSLLNQCDLEFFEIQHLIKDNSHQHIQMKYGVLLTMLYHLEKAQLITRYIQNNQDYFHIEEAGTVRLDMLQRDYATLTEGIQHILTSEVTHHE